jgi:hypothetical protein
LRQCFSVCVWYTRHRRFESDKTSERRKSRGDILHKRFASYKMPFYRWKRIDFRRKKGRERERGRPSSSSSSSSSLIFFSCTASLLLSSIPTLHLSPRLSLPLPLPSFLLFAIKKVTYSHLPFGGREANGNILNLCVFKYSNMISEVSSRVLPSKGLKKT